MNRSMEQHFWRSLEDFLGESRRNHLECDKIHTFTRDNLEHFYSVAFDLCPEPDSDGLYAFVDVNCIFGEKKMEQIMKYDCWEIICLC